MSLTSLLEKNAVVKKPVAKKSKAPSIELPAELKVAVDKVNEAKVAKENAESEIELYGSKIISHVREVQDRDGRASNYSKSYDVAGEKEKSSLKVVFANKFSIAAEDEHLIEEILGDKYPELIETKYVVTVKAEVLKDAKLSKKLETLLGAEFNTFFDVVKSLVVVKDFDEKILSGLI